MVNYKPSKGMGMYYILGIMLFYDILTILAILLINSYVISTLLKIFLVFFTIYQMRYILLYYTLKYSIDDENVYISGFLKNVKIPFKDIEGYKTDDGKINGVKLSGFGTNSFALGKSVIKKIGTTNMFVTSGKNIIYLKVGDTSYGISPAEYDKFKNTLSQKEVKLIDWEYKWNKGVSLYKDKLFMVAFLAEAAVITILTLNPFILYLMGRLPDKMPLNFDAAFIAVEYGTGKQFAFNQMVYGVLNMAIQFCMYYASHFYAKYDRKSAKKFMYASLIISLAFLIIQIRILYTFR